MRGAALDYFSIQVGLSRHVIREFVNDWTVRIEDLSATVAKMHKLIRAGKADAAKRHLPAERTYELPSAIARRLMMA